MLNVGRKIKSFNRLDENKKFALIMPLIILFILFLGLKALPEDKQKLTTPSSSGHILKETVLPDVRHIDPRKIELSVCTDRAEQPECYDNDFPIPRLTWQCSGKTEEDKVGDYVFILQIDNDIDFSSPDMDTGPVTTDKNYYTVSKAGLEPGKSYYWRVRGQNSAGEWSGWATEEDSFVVAPLCKDYDQNTTN